MCWRRSNNELFKRLKDKFATNKENEEVKSLTEEQGQDKLEDTHSEGSTQDVNDLAENAEVKSHASWVKRILMTMAWYQLKILKKLKLKNGC